MNVDEAVAKFFQQGKSNGHVVDKSTALACGGQLAADNRIVLIRLQIVLVEERIHILIMRQVEMCLHHALVGTLLQRLHIGTLAKQQAYGTEDDALSGACLACDDREAAMELHIQLVDEREVTYIKMCQQRSIINVQRKLPDNLHLAAHAQLDDARRLVGLVFLTARPAHIVHLLDDAGIDVAIILCGRLATDIH